MNHIHSTLSAILYKIMLTLSYYKTELLGSKFDGRKKMDRQALTEVAGLENASSLYLDLGLSCSKISDTIHL